MKFLLTNDDGVFSIGIQTAAKRLSDEGHEVLVVAPDRERSAPGSRRRRTACRTVVPHRTLLRGGKPPEDTATRAPVDRQR